jgi:hypothetical protein
MAWSWKAGWQPRLAVIRICSSVNQVGQRGPWLGSNAYTHAGTTDVDVQVDLEIAAGSVHTTRLETALRNAEFEPDTERAWRWTAEGLGTNVVVRFELLADLDDQPEGVTVTFDECEDLGAANLRGTGYAARDVEVRQVAARATKMEERERDEKSTPGASSAW